MNHSFTQLSIEKKIKRESAIFKKLFHMVEALFLELLLLASIAVPVMGISVGLGVYNGILSGSPSIENISVVPTKYSTFILDTKGKVSATLVMEDSNRILVTEDKLPENLKNAFIAIEDERFYTHNGIDIQGIVRAGKDVIDTRSFSQGASTITQQLIKNNVFSSWMEESSYLDSVKRKLQEQYLAVLLETKMPKNEILLNYLNTINLGQNTLGVEAAALRYFDKHVEKLNLSECAVLAAITQNPSKYNPISNPSENSARRMRVLNNMLTQGLITREEYDEAMADPVYNRIHKKEEENPENTINSYFVDSLTKVLMEDLQAAGYSYEKAFELLYSGGLRVYSTQDPEIQAIADRIFEDEENYPAGTQYLLSYRLSTKAGNDVKNYSTEMFKAHFLEKNKRYELLYNKKESALEDIETFKTEVLSPGETVIGEEIELIPQPQVSLTIQDQSTGYVTAMVGGRGDKKASRTLNRATDSFRQPGSTFKVVSTYVPALDAGGFTLNSTQIDAPFAYQDGTVVNNWYDDYRGVCTLRSGIKDSLNIVAVKTLTDITPQLGYDYLLKLGFTTLVKDEMIGGKMFTDIQQTLALGGITKGVYNLELNASYAAIANDGMYIKPKYYTKVTDNQGNVILTTDNYRKEQVMKRATAYYITSALRDVVTSGTGTACNFDGKMAIAGKTGTTSKYVDQWFTGFTPYYTATVWTGYDDNTVLNTAEKRALAKTMWTKTMKAIHEELNLPKIGEFKEPRDLEKTTFCKWTGLLPGASCPKTESLFYDKELIPTETCDGKHTGKPFYRDSGDAQSGELPQDILDYLSALQSYGIWGIPGYGVPGEYNPFSGLGSGIGEDGFAMPAPSSGSGLKRVGQ